ncbi:type IV pilus biogenesis protein PilM [Sporosarcina pasteurii]|uniref:Type IV pilus assembly protein PilM n=1 Tax=Sporosarcina pasteurii TaxID=1474 RepID=A0A380BVN7_SPOPA|nr:pilus assembly protein PilM [Sporosarcina pasteurii]MDS9471334.1 pilus assembly protein PilM [Sporosarcina pasteurii]SUJ07834.1 type IV pilus assembly protein PilM [Sporosarcina pasteurii]
MFNRFKKKKRTVSIELNDFYIRALSFTEGELDTTLLFEQALPSGLVEEEVVQDEMALYDLLKTLVKEWNISKHELRFFVPGHAVLMRTIEHPEELNMQEIKEYVEMELGETIHLPFEQPLIDMYDADPDDGVATLFAAPSEEVMQLMRLYEDVQLEPAVLDIRALCNIRFLKNIQMLDAHKTYLIADWSVNAVSICIYSDGNVDFLRYQPIETEQKNWRYLPENTTVPYFYEGEISDYQMHLTNQTLELERILNFYRYSLHKGEKAVNELVMMGDNPEMDFIMEKIGSTLELPIRLIDNEIVKQHYPNFKAEHATLLGLSLREEAGHGS